MKNGDLQVGRQISGESRGWVIISEGEESSSWFENSKKSLYKLQTWWEKNESTPSHLLSKIRGNSSEAIPRRPHKRNKRRQSNPKPSKNYVQRKYQTKLETTQSGKKEMHGRLSEREYSKISFHICMCKNVRSK